MPNARADIQVVTWFEAVRRRPAMYIGDTSHFGLLWLVRELVDVPLEPTNISLALHGTTFCMAASSVPPSVQPREPDRLPFLVEACTHLMLPLDHPATLAGVETLDGASTFAKFVRNPVVPPCLAIANALSRAFTVASISRGLCWRAEFSNGVLVAPLASLPSEAPSGLTISFAPDPDIFGDASLDFRLLAKLAREVALVRRVPVEARDENSGRVFVARGGAS